MKEGWEIKKLGDICKIQTGKLDANAKVDDGEYPFFTCDSKPYKIDRYAFDDEAILISGNGSLVGHINYYKGKFNAYQRTYVLTQFNSYHLPFLIRYLKGYLRPYIIENKKGGCIPYITLPILQNFHIPFPTYAEQEKIVAELDCLSGIIEKKKQQLKEYDALAQSIFYEMFGDPVENEKGWEMKKLKELSSLIINGTTPKGGAEVYVDKGILFLRSQNVWKNRIDYDDIAHIDEKTNASMKKSILHKYDILITKTGRINTENSSLGRAALFEGETGSANINGHVYLIRLNGILVLPRFVLSILTSLVYRDYIRKVCVGGIDKRQINKEHVEDFPIIIPSISLQKQYVDAIEAIEKQKALIKKSIEEIETLFNSRMDYYFN